ncbi:hypothetical protein CW745_05105 [Psychromonas sp. psych-6C06]|nr:hypothetical protein CW745_05105 [Psychromonas sp. psych-6C06]
MQNVEGKVSSCLIEKTGEMTLKIIIESIFGRDCLEGNRLYYTHQMLKLMEIAEAECNFTFVRKGKLDYTFSNDIVTI